MLLWQFFHKHVGNLGVSPVCIGYFLDLWTSLEIARWVFIPKGCRSKLVSQWAHKKSQCPVSNSSTFAGWSLWIILPWIKSCWSPNHLKSSQIIPHFSPFPCLPGLKFRLQCSQLLLRLCHLLVPWDGPFGHVGWWFQQISKFCGSEILKDPCLENFEHTFWSHTDWSSSPAPWTYPISKPFFEGIAGNQRFLRKAILLAHLSCLGCCHHHWANEGGRKRCSGSITVLISRKFRGRPSKTTIQMFGITLFIRKHVYETLRYCHITPATG